MICPKCAIQTPVGFRCKECVRGLQAKYYNAESKDNLIAFAISLGISTIATPFASYFLGFLGFFYGLILAAMFGSGAGGALSQIIRKAINRRRGQYVGLSAIVGLILGVLIGVGGLALVMGYPLMAIGALFMNPVFLLFAVLTGVSLYQFLK